VSPDWTSRAHARLRTPLRLVRGPAAVLVVYLVLWSVFAARAGHGGLLRPSGGIDSAFALLGLAVLGMRLVVLFVLPAMVAYRVVMRLLAIGPKR
jgi:hypothetical protein